MKGRVLDLGRRGYEEVWELQKWLVRERANNESPDTLILVEHEHVITLGRRTSAENIGHQGAIPVYSIERGGDATYHGPGQLVGYPIQKLQAHDVHRYLRMLEEVLIRATRSYGIASERIDGRTGVWVGSNKKIASIGVAVSDWVTYHGFALNVNTDLSYFHLIKPCGLDPEMISSMAKVLERPVEMREVKARVIEDFSSVFEMELLPVTLDGLLTSPPPGQSFA